MGASLRAAWNACQHTDMVECDKAHGHDLILVLAQFTWLEEHANCCCKRLCNNSYKMTAMETAF